MSAASPTPRVSVVWSAHPEPDLADRLVRREAAGWLGVEESALRLVRVCPWCGSARHGRPTLVRVPGQAVPQVSISRAGPVTVVALSTAGPVGVDVEPERAAGFDGFDSVALHAQEAAADPRDRTVTWVRKESLLKATGHGLGTDPRRLRLTGPGEPPALLTWVDAEPPAPAVWMYDVVTAPGHAASVTVLAPTRPELVVRQVPPTGPEARSAPATR